MSILKNYITAWNWMRALRLVLGIAVLTEGIMWSDPAIILFGSFFTMLPLMNQGCGCGSGCIPQSAREDGKYKDNPK